MRASVEALAQRGTVNVSHLVEHDGDIEFPTLQLRAMVHNATPGAVAFHETTDALALTYWLHRDALIAALDSEIDTEADDKAALTVEARQRQEAEVMADLLAIERDESALVWRAQNEGLPCEHRGDVSPVALLGLVLVTTPRAALPQSTRILVVAEMRDRATGGFLPRSTTGICTKRGAHWSDPRYPLAPNIINAPLVVLVCGAYSLSRPFGFHARQNVIENGARF